MLEGPKDVVGDAVAQARSEDVCGGGLGVIPDRERGVQVRDLDVHLAVEQGEDQREPHALRFGPRRHRPEQSRLLGR
jgi:hypothetical protein